MPHTSLFLSTSTSSSADDDKSEYSESESTCLQRIRVYEAHQFSQQFLGSVVEVPPLRVDEFKELVVPLAAKSPAQILRTVRQQIQSTREHPALPLATYYLLTF